MNRAQFAARFGFRSRESRAPYPANISDMTDQELQDLLADLESDRVERKASFADPERVSQAVCAFANDMPNHQLPGVVFIGASDDGTCAALKMSDQLLLTLAHLRSDGNIVPIPFLI